MRLLFFTMWRDVSIVYLSIFTTWRLTSFSSREREIERPRWREEEEEGEKETTMKSHTIPWAIEVVRNRSLKSHSMGGDLGSIFAGRIVQEFMDIFSSSGFN